MQLFNNMNVKEFFQILQASGAIDGATHYNLSLTSKNYQLELYTLKTLIENEVTFFHDISLPESHNTDINDTNLPITQRQILEDFIEENLSKGKALYAKANHDFGKWLNRDNFNAQKKELVAIDKALDALANGCEVMFVKMFKAILSAEKRLEVAEAFVKLNLAPDTAIYIAANLGDITFLNAAIRSESPEIIKRIFEIYPAETRLSMLQKSVESDWNSTIIIHDIVCLGNSKLIKDILEMLQNDQERNTAIRILNADGQNLLF